jgi:ubiquitin-activating enzyme E1 C
MTTYTQTTTDWPGRYYHVDQVLDKPGPRTDPEMFVGGDTVSISLNLYRMLRVICR